MATPTTPQLTITLLGATGRTGREVLSGLLKRDIHHLKIYVRSKQKLINLFPQLLSDTRVEICEGEVTNQETMQACLSGAKIIINTIGGYSFFPDGSLQRAAESIVMALQGLRNNARTDGRKWEKPRMLLLSSSSRNERFAAARPKLVHWLIETAFQNGYNDLKLAHKAVLVDPSLVSVLFVQPGVLIEEEATGSYISTEEVKLACSYEDLGAAFVDLALERGYDELREVGVSSELGNRAARYAPIMLRKIAAGFFAAYVPGALHITNFLEGVQRLIW
ncbi:hypothetical protein LTR84_001715 [Exophiala bonariae]|uniref:NAD(P)-binding domain-containing protein n=1 Tax=Exophiala bonariae TaxID=1690606 RepID=A0AAV9NDI9_9EURO|nr:hypothetical protein LTR84_001715 [Exophiala bonariae]